MPSKTATRTPLEFPRSPLRQAEEMGLHVVLHLRESIKTAEGQHYLPRDLLGRDGKTLIVHRQSDRDYDFTGWEPWHDGMFGGRYASIESALAWVQCAMDIRAGRAEHF